MKNFRIGISLVFITAFVSGFSIFLNAYGVKGIEPGLFAGLKNLSVGILIIAGIIAAREWRNVRGIKPVEWAQLALIGLVGGSVPFVMFFTGLVQSEAGKAGFIHKLMFVFVSFLAVAFLKERLTRYAWLGIGTLLVGQVIFLGLIPSSFNFGDALIFGAMLLWTVEIVLSKKLLASLSANIVSAGRMFFGGIFIWVFLGITGKADAVTSLSIAQWQWVAITTLLLVGYVLTFYHGLKRVPAHVATAVLSLGAPITLLLQAVFLNQTITVMQIAGSGLMFLSLIWIIMRMRRTATHELLLTPDHH